MTMIAVKVENSIKGRQHNEPLSPTLHDAIQTISILKIEIEIEREIVFIIL